MGVVEVDNDYELTAYCGLYCGDCFRYHCRVSELSGNLLSELGDMHFEKYAEYKSGSAKQFDPVPEFEHYTEFCKVLEAIVALQCNSPCRTGNGCPAFSCDILECCRSRGFDGCWECEEFESCLRFEKLEACHGDGPRRNLRIIRELGLDNWADNRCKPYVWM